jgi:Family of unknown function (DUF5995)
MSTDAEPTPSAVSGTSLPVPSTVPEVITCLDAIQSQAVAADSQGPRDGLASFNYLYRSITGDVQEKLNAGLFRDKEFVITLDVEFAKRYLHAIALYQAAPKSAPRSWQVLLDRRANPDIAPLQFAVAGVNAHVNFDLPFALVATCESLGSPLGSDTQREDYQHINQIFAEQMAALRHHFEDPVVQDLDRSTVSTVNNDLDELTVVLTRDAAWYRAEHLWTLRDQPHALDAQTETMDVLVSLAGRGLLVHF